MNSVQSYSLTGIHSNDFDLDYSSIDIPYLIVRSALDHQRISSYSLTLIASDNNQRSGSMQIDIRIINASMPIFLQSVYHVDIREDTPIGTSVLKIEATSDENEQIFYELVGQSPFLIDRLTGKIQLKKFLDYEREQFYRLTIKAYENSLPSYAIIFIHVIDVNDNPVLIHIQTEGKRTRKEHLHCSCSSSNRKCHNETIIPRSTRPFHSRRYSRWNDIRTCDSSRFGFIR